MKNNIKYTHFTGGICKLTSQSMKVIIGERHKELSKAIKEAYDFRNKIIHGQQTGQNLGSDRLAACQSHVREWCTILANEGMNRFDYDGFARNSLHKTHRKDVTASVDGAPKHSGWGNSQAPLSSRF